MDGGAAEKVGIDREQNRINRHRTHTKLAAGKWNFLNRPANATASGSIYYVVEWARVPSNCPLSALLNRDPTRGGGRF